MADAVRRSEHTDLTDLRKGIDKVVYNRYKYYKQLYKQIYNLEPMTTRTAKDTSVSGLSMATKKLEGQSIRWDKPLKGYTYTYTPDAYGMGIRITMEMQQDDQFGIIKKQAAELGRQMNYRVEYDGASLFINAFDSGVGGDAKYLCDTEHPLGQGQEGTYDNMPSVATDLSITSLRSAIENIKATPDDRGQLLHLKPKVLLVPRELKWAAYEILLSDKRAYTGDNTMNAFKDEGIKIVVWDMLTDANAWFLMTDKAEHSIQFRWRMKPKSSMGDDFDTADLKYKQIMRYAYGFSDWRGVYGSAGAA